MRSRTYVEDCTVALLIGAAIEDLEATGDSSFEEEMRDCRLYVRRATCTQACGPCWAVRVAVRHRFVGWEPLELDDQLLGYENYELCPGAVADGDLCVIRDSRRH